MIQGGRLSVFFHALAERAVHLAANTELHRVIGVGIRQNVKKIADFHNNFLLS